MKADANRRNEKTVDAKNMTVDIKVMRDASEIIQYDTKGIPLSVIDTRLSHYPDMRALPHWHEDIEFIHVRKGAMFYKINEEIVPLQEGNCLMVNSRQMHHGYSNQYQECIFTCVLVHPSLFSANRELFRAYVEPIVKDSGVPYLCLDSHERPEELFYSILQIKYQNKNAYELEVIGLLHTVWSKLCRQWEPLACPPAGLVSPDLRIQRDMVSFIHQHYGEKLTLSDIALAGNVCRSKCCRIFRHYLQQSPIDFLNSYRLEVSRNLLCSTDLSVTQIATACGFNHLSYYSELFLRRYGCTPTACRAADSGRESTPFQ